MGGRDLPDGALDLGQFAGSRLGVGFAEPNGHGSYPRFPARRGTPICMGDQLIPSIDETIQLFVPGRAGMITDVMIDCCGAATGVVLRYLLRSLMCAKKAA